MNNGNMYNFIDRTWNPLAGRCPHKCTYCYVQAMARSRPAMAKKYSGPIRLCDQKLPKGSPIFVCSCNDLFASTVPKDIIMAVFKIIKEHPDREFVIQSKNVSRMVDYAVMYRHSTNITWGTTIESDAKSIDYSSISKAEHPIQRAVGMKVVASAVAGKTFITVEPILLFSDSFWALLWMTDVDFINVGYDSKHTPGLPVPEPAKISQLVRELRDRIMTVNIKSNLHKIIPER